MKHCAAPQEFVSQVRYALRHIYDPQCLTESALQGTLQLDDTRHPYANLQETLLGAIADLEPTHDVPRESAVWRTHHLLVERYVEQIPLRDIAFDLTVGLRQLRRLNAEAVQSLADLLWARYASYEPPAKMPLTPATDRPLPPEATAWELVAYDVHQSEPTESVPLSELVDSVLDTVEPLLLQGNTRVERIYTMRPQISVAVQMPATRHALIGLVSVSARLATKGLLSIDITTTTCEARISITTYGSKRSRRLSPDLEENLAVAQSILALSSASHEVQEDAEGSFAGLDILIPLAERVPVLVVDDNADWIRLYQRCLADSRYRLISATDPEQAVAVAQECMPQVVILDLMFEESDGWALLGRLRALPGMTDVPIIVCTILPHKDLALALGAAELIRKPFTQESLLSALDQQVFAEGRQSR